MKILPRINDEIAVVVGRTEPQMASLRNKQEFILLPFGYRLLYLVAIIEHHLYGHIRVYAATARIRSKYYTIGVPVLVKQSFKMACLLQKEKKPLHSANGSTTDRKNATIPAVVLHMY